MADTVTTNVKNCARCGGNHDALKFSPLNEPSDDYTFWAMCPKLLQPLLMKVTVIA